MNLYSLFLVLGASLKASLKGSELHVFSVFSPAHCNCMTARDGETLLAHAFNLLLYFGPTSTLQRVRRILSFGCHSHFVSLHRRENRSLFVLHRLCTHRMFDRRVPHVPRVLNFDVSFSTLAAHTRTANWIKYMLRAQCQ